MSNETHPLAITKSTVEFTDPTTVDPNESQPASHTSDVSDVKSISHSVPNSSKKRYQENYTRRRSKTHSLYDHSALRNKDDGEVANISSRCSVENLVETKHESSVIDQMTYPRPIASINVSRVASASTAVTEPFNEVIAAQQLHHPSIRDGQERLRPSIISLFGRIVSRNNSNTDANEDGEIGIRARILRAFSYVGKRWSAVLNIGHRFIGFSDRRNGVY